MALQLYGLDESARCLVKNQTESSQKQVYKMRAAVAYGLERFWGESMRLQDKEPDKAEYWRSVWNKLADILQPANIALPRHQDVQPQANSLWNLEKEDRQIALAVLTQLCDCLVWWTQRYF